MQGEGPYSMATAMINVSPIPIMVLDFVLAGKTRKAGTVTNVRMSRISQSASCGTLIKFQIAHVAIGKAAAVTRAIRALTLNGSCFHVMPECSEDNSSDPISAFYDCELRN